MKAVLLGIALVLLLAGVTTGMWSRRYLTETGRALPWYQRLSPVWVANPYYTPVGKRLVRVSGITASLGALLYLVTQFAR